VLSTRACSKLLEILYAAPLDEAQWQVFLTQLCEITGSDLGLFLRNDSTLGSRILASGGAPIPAETDRTYRQSHSYVDPFRQAYMRNPRIGVIEGEDLVPHEVWIGTDTYKAIATPYRDASQRPPLDYMTCLALTNSVRSQDIISMWRSSRQRLDPEHHELLVMLVPHLQNALQMRRALGLAEARTRNAEAMLDASETASILLDGAGRILHMNQAAQQIALAADGFAVDIDRIVPTDSALRAEFGALLTACAAADLGHPGGALALPRSTGARPLQILIAPLRIAGNGGSAVRVLLLATDPDHAIVFPDNVLRQIYGLTPAEIEIANALLTGLSLEEIARLRHVSGATVRAQMKRLLAKTQTSRQADLVRLLSTLPRTPPAI
jgi:DNA-binding CsgD family transcriptional regulator